MLFEQISSIIDRLTALVGAGGEWETCKVALFKDGAFVPASDMTYADLVAGECDFTGYARSSAIVWGAPYADSLKRGVVAGGSKQFQASGSAVANNVGGYAVVDSAGTKIIWAESFNAPRVMDENADAIIVVPKYTYGRIQAV